MYLIEPYNPFDKNQRKKHWTEIAEEEALYHQLVLEKIGQQQTQNDSVLNAIGEGPNATGAGAGGVPPLSFFLPSSTGPFIPIALAATNANSNSFRANWQSSTGATNYFIDISTTGSFSSFVAGFQNKSIGNITTITASSLTSDTDYFYRLRAANTIGTSSNSNVIMLHTDPFNTLSASITITITAPLYYIQGSGTEGGGGAQIAPVRALTAGTHTLPIDTFYPSNQVTESSIVFGYLDTINSFNINGDNNQGSGAWWLLYESDDAPFVWQPESFGLIVDFSTFLTFHEAAVYMTGSRPTVLPPLTFISASKIFAP